MWFYRISPRIVEVWRGGLGGAYRLPTHWSRVNRYTNEQNTAKQMIVSHHGLNGIGNKSTINHKRHDQPFREGDGASPPVFARISIVERGLKETHGRLSESQFIATCLVTRLI